MNLPSSILLPLLCPYLTAKIKPQKGDLEMHTRTWLICTVIDRCHIVKSSRGKVCRSSTDNPQGP